MRHPMRKYALFLISLCLVSVSGLFAQMMNPVKWTYEVKYGENNQAELIFTAKVESGWHLYSQENPPNPLEFVFDKSDAFKREGKVTEPKPKKMNDEYLGPVAYFETATVVFKQKISIVSSEPFKIKGSIYGQACMDDGVCLPVDEKFVFSVTVGGREATLNPNDADEDGIENALDKCPDVAGIASLMGCPDSDGDGIADFDDECPQLPGDSLNKGCPVITESGETVIPEMLSDEALAGLEEGCGGDGWAAEKRTFWGIFIAGFLGGLFALLTPCVFPMIPLTVSFFTKQSKTRAKGISNALIYALSIIVIYTGLGFLVTKLAGPDALNRMASSAFWNMLFFIIFVVFAASFLGAFEITLPSRFVNAVDKGSNKGGLIGIFFMAFTLSLVSFSCTGPIIGTLLVEAAVSGSNAGPLMGMFGFSLALALPFALFAMFPGWLNTLPKSGGWLNTVKVSLGLLELALALKFFSVVDMAYHWGILKREIFLALWIIIFSLLGLYLLGGFKLSHDSDDKPKLSVIRLSFAIISLGFAIYIIPGLFGAPVKLLSGLAPPTNYREWNPTECPHGLDCYHDYDEGMQKARRENKPVLIDFTGYACVNCRKMEDNVWSVKKVLNKLQNDYVVISLYVDDKNSLPAGKEVKSYRTGEILKTYGAKWSDFQAYFYKANTQPQYILLDPNGKLLAAPRSYTPNADEYDAFLQEGFCRYNKRRGRY